IATIKGSCIRPRLNRSMQRAARGESLGGSPDGSVSAGTTSGTPRDVPLERRVAWPRIAKRETSGNTCRMTEPESKREKMGFLYKDWQKNHCSEAASQQLCTRYTAQCKNSAVASFKPANLFPKGRGKLENGIWLKEASNQNSGHAMSMTSSSNAPKLKKHHLLNIFPEIKFTCKEETDNKLSFFNVEIRRLDNGELEI
ncbi:hypothetical protein E2320_017413, partial [Naja naja]